jgi:hypothetical protein
VVAVSQYEHRLCDTVEQFKAIVQLVDGTRLHISEVWVGGELRKYAYFQVTPDGQIIRGWDNAPHHPEVDTYPHHLHMSKGIHPSTVRALVDVLDILAEL